VTSAVVAIAIVNEKWLPLSYRLFG